MSEGRVSVAKYSDFGRRSLRGENAHTVSKLATNHFHLRLFRKSKVDGPTMFRQTLCVGWARLESVS